MPYCLGRLESYMDTSLLELKIHRALASGLRSLMLAPPLTSLLSSLGRFCGSSIFSGFQSNVHIFLTAGSEVLFSIGRVISAARFAIAGTEGTE